MAEGQCRWAGSCPFFSDPVGYSPEMGTLFIERFCNGEYHACARFVGRTVMGVGAVPDEMLPTDFPQLDRLLIAWNAARDDDSR